MEINVVHRALKLNDEFAGKVRAVFDRHGIVTLNLMSAPGSGKTTLLEETIRRWPSVGDLAVVEGDPDTTLDAERIQALGVPVTQINTQGGCHLEAHLVQQALESFDLDAVKVLFIENVGNMLCPVGFDLGERLRVAILSVTEGADKPAKYPKLFRTSDVVVLNKADLLPHIDFDLDYFRKTVQALNPGVPILTVSCRTGEGLDTWMAWLQTAVTQPEGIVL